MENYDNLRYTYEQVLSGTGYYMQDNLLRYSVGVKTTQEKLNATGYNCGTPNGKFDSGTNTAVRDFQSAKWLTIDGKVGNGMTSLYNSSGNVDIYASKIEAAYTTFKNA